MTDQEKLKACQNCIQLLLSGIAQAFPDLKDCPDKLKVAFLLGYKLSAALELNKELKIQEQELKIQEQQASLN